jgi:hypothetical protein
MSSLERLMSSLRLGPQPVIRPYPYAELEEQEGALTARLEKRDANIKPPIDAIIEAVELFRQTSRFRNSRDAKLVAFGCAEPIGRTQYRLIEDAEKFPLVLKGAESFRTFRPAFRGCYKGLLETYLSYHPDEHSGKHAGRLNWTNLREWLDANLASTREPAGVDAAWVTEVSSNPALFSDNPVQAFGRELLDDAEASFVRFKRAVGIRETSWLIGQLVLQQVHIAGKAGNPTLTRYLPKLITLLENLTAYNATVFNEALGLMLTYFHDAPPVVVHPGLRDFSVRHWGNPWLHGGIDEWDLVEDSVRQMVVSWLKLDSIQKFFGVLAQEGAGDMRRLRFWEKYSDAVDDVRFALGSHARNSQDADMKNVRGSMKELMVDLLHGGAAKNNAFIMRFGEWVLVEFGFTGNRCFFFRATDLPFNPHESSVSATAIRGCIQDTALRSARDPIKLRHDDTNEGDWEYRFAREMGKRGIFPDRKSTESTPRWAAEVAARKTAAKTAQDVFGFFPDRSSPDISTPRQTVPQQSITRPVVRLPFGPKQEAELQAICRRLRVVVRDMRRQDGNLLVMLDSPEDSRLTPLLQSYGFQYKPGRGWWFKN